MLERKYLMGPILLRSLKSGQIVRFEVGKMLGVGAACGSYEARRDGKWGVLKEFWPLPEFDSRAASALDRSIQGKDEGQLVFSAKLEALNIRFREVQKEFEDCHLKLQKAIEENEQSRELSRYFPSFEMYRASIRDGEDGTTYLWFEGAGVQADTTFEAFCKKLREDPLSRPEYNLAVALHAVLSLAKCIQLLHGANMLHRDIKPENFGFLKANDKILTQFPCIFDLDTICPAAAPPGEVIGTSGYTEPEAAPGLKKYYPSVQTDIYAIGAVLFHAVIITEETWKTGNLYDPIVHGRVLKELVDKSKLIQATERNSHPRLRTCLTRILTRCLSIRQNRYRNCDDLVRDLEDAFFYIMPSEEARKHRRGEQWILKGVEEKLDVNKNKNSTLAIQYHLYEHPIYQHCTEKDASINILAVGLGNYGQKFLDVCLQMGQCCEKPLRVTVLSEAIPDDPYMEMEKQDTDADRYLAERPALADFFHIINGGTPLRTVEEDSYGSVTFQQTTLDLADKEASRRTLEDIVCDQEQPFHYVFIATGDDELNRDIAEMYRTTAASCEYPPAHISYAHEGNANADSAGLYPVWVNKQMEENTLHQEIERMAFNVHRIWEKDWNRDMKAVQEAFRKKYNHDACVAHVLALKYTLDRLGIPLELGEIPDFNGAARRFVKKLDNADNRSSLKDELIYAEHRRWVAEKLCLGWRGRDVRECINWSTKDEENRRHVCIVRSRPDQKLTNDTNHTPKKWDELSEAGLAKFDPLDQVSVKLHQFYREKAKKAKDMGLLSENHPLSGLRSVVVQDIHASASFQEWFICAKDIQNEDQEKACLYDGLRETFLLAAERLEPDTRKYVQNTVEQFNRDFQPIVASMKYQDLKQEDVKLIDNIPFILTYTEDACLVIPYTASSDANPFGNVAAATVVNPKTVLYLLQIDREDDIWQLERSFMRTAGYMSKKCPQTRMDVLVLCAGDMAKRVERGLRRQSWRESCKQVGDVAQVTSLHILCAELQSRQAGTRFFAVEKNETSLSRRMQQQGIYDALPSYRFHADDLKFDELDQCDALGYIWEVPCITAADLFTLGRALSKNSDRPEFGDDYESLWEKYSSDPSTWKKLCGALKDEPKKGTTPSLVRLARLQTKWMKAAEKPQKYRYIIPFICAKAARKIVDRLINEGILGRDSFVTGYTTDSCKVVLSNPYEYSYAQEDVFKREYDKLFSNFYALMGPDDIKIVPINPTEDYGRYVVEFDSLTVSDALLPNDDGNKCLNLLQHFNEEGYILNLRIEVKTKQNDEKYRTASFTYGSRQIKQLLTMEGKILEVYTYQRMKELQRFDDVVTGSQVNWRDGEDKNEFDCIATKGFRTLVVECKATSRLQEKYYTKLRSLTDQLGINAVPVLVADTRRDERFAENPENALLREAGREQGIITVWKRSEIDDIGRTLLRIMGGTYGRSKNKSE